MLHLLLTPSFFPPNHHHPSLPLYSTFAYPSPKKKKKSIFKKVVKTWLVPVDVSIVEALDTRLQTVQRRVRPLAITAVWKVTYRVTARWNKRQNLAIAVGERVTFRVIAPNLKTPVALEEGQEVAVLARSAIAAARSVTLRVRAPRHPEEVQEEATAVEAVEATVVLGAGAVKKHVTLAVE